jgi:3-hydroxybutyryl-CoA dehydrogenase
VTTEVAPTAAGPSSHVTRVAVVGGGVMGNGIAQTFASAGFDVELVEVRRELADKALAAIRSSLERLARKQGWPEDRASAALGRIRGGIRLEAARECQVVVEAVSEDAALKRRVFEQLDRAAPPDAVLASNTSSISITELAAATGRPASVIGMHFMNPVPLMPLVEVIRGQATSDATCALVEDLCRRLGKTPVEVNDFPGFVSNRVLMPMINEAVYCLMEGVASKEAIDAVMRLGMSHPLGPLQLADLIGLDTCLAILEVLHRELGDPKYRPCPLLRRMVRAGALGRKSGRGFYEYPSGG